MNDIFTPPAVLVLKDGSVFYGKAIGKIGTTTGEICFNTGMTGYQEVFTDPSYFGQILISTCSHIGNYGMKNSEVESDSIKIAGLVCKKFSDTFSRPGADQSINEDFLKEGLVGISDVDTRELVRHIRDKGAMNAIISSDVLDVDVLKRRLDEIPSMEGLELASKVSTKEAYTLNEGKGEFKVAILDIGLKRSIAQCLVDRGCSVKVFPHNTSATEILNWNPDGVLLSNGPGDPSAMNEVVDNVKKLVESEIPLFGICLGHQVLSLSQGLKTEKMHNGHRGINHPIKNLISGKCEVASHNHGFVVSRESAKENSSVEVSHIHLNDNSLSGIRLKDKDVFSVQYHPEASPGPHDSRYLFDEFLKLIAKNGNKILS